MIRYRFKTEQEFITEFGENWRDYRNCDVYFAHEMDHFFNKNIEDIDYYYEFGYDYEKINISNFDLKNDELRFTLHGGWTISMDMLKQVGINYNEKKTLVYD